jgi:hypothetical protein
MPGVIDMLRLKEAEIIRRSETCVTGFDQGIRPTRPDKRIAKATPIAPAPTIATSTSVVPPSARASPMQIMRSPATIRSSVGAC